jgi:hypothetical protein
MCHQNRNRRNILLGGSTLAAASALTANAPIHVAQAQEQLAPPSGKRSNILVIFPEPAPSISALEPKAEQSARNPSGVHLLAIGSEERWKTPRAISSTRRVHSITTKTGYPLCDREWSANHVVTRSHRLRSPR